MVEITKEQRRQYYNNLQKDLGKTKNFILNTDNLYSIFTDEFFSTAHNQIEELNENKWGLVHPLWNLMLSYEPDNGFAKLKLLDEYLTLIFSHSTTKKANKEYIKKELVSSSKINSLNILFEISILGLLLKYFDQSKIVLYPKTIGNKNVEVSVILIGREVYIEATVIGESEEDQNKRIEMTNKNKRVWGGSRDIDKDTGRVTLRLENKAGQMIGGKPNVLMLGTYDFQPNQFNIKSSIEGNQFSNIGLIMQFNRVKLEEIFKEGLDSNCLLLKDEEKMLASIFSDKYVSLIYGQ